jgi:hypothetical protein
VGRAGLVSVRCLSPDNAARCTRPARVVLRRAGGDAVFHTCNRSPAACTDEAVVLDPRRICVVTTNTTAPAPRTSALTLDPRPSRSLGSASQ